MLEKDVGTQLTSTLAGVEQRCPALRVAGGNVGAVPQQQLCDDDVGELSSQVKWGAKLRVLYGAGVKRPVSRMGQEQENGGHVLGLHCSPQLAAQRLLGSAQRRQEQQLLVLGANP